MKRITAFEVDGTLFTDEQAALNAEKAHAIEQLQTLCREQFENNGTYTNEMIAEVLAGAAGKFAAVLQRLAAIRAAPQGPDPEVLSRKVHHLELSLRTERCLVDDGVVYVGQLVQKSEKDIRGIPNSGRKTLAEIKELLAIMGLHLGMSLPDWSVPTTPVE